MWGEEGTINICFHGIGEPARELEVGEACYWITRDQYLTFLDEIVHIPDVRISFDDSNTSDVEVGLSGLVDRGLTATFFALAGRIGARGSLDADQLRTLASRGMTIGTHGMDHRPWPAMDAVERNRELVVAREQIAEIVSAPVDQAALPLGRYNRRLLVDLRTLGYLRVHTSDRRRASSHSWLQPRFSIRRDDTLESLRRTILARPRLHDQLRLSSVGLAKRLR